MKRLTEQNPDWIDDELWMSAREPDDEEIDKVYHRLREYEDTELTPDQIREIDELYTEKCEEVNQLKKQLKTKVGGDLISRKTLLDRFTESFQNINYHPDFGDPAVGMEQELFNEFLYDMVKLVEEQPTAYDVDRVIEKLEATARGEWGYPSVMEFDDVVEIVKGGGNEA